jgi:phospholipid/cholesterol/gamma-HCH transport system substrate-binding protein
MAIQYKGFTIGHVKKISLTEDDRVEVLFTIFEEHNHRVKEGSMVEVQVSPIGLGNQFSFHPGKGIAQLPEGAAIPEVNSIEAKQLIAAGLTDRSEASDSIGNIMSWVSVVLSDLDSTLSDVREAIAGSERLTLGRTLLNVEDITQTLSIDLGSLLAQLDSILVDINKVTTGLSAPDGAVMSALDTEGPVYKDIVAVLDSVVSALDSVAVTLKGVEKVGDFIPAQLPQIALLLSNVNSTLRVAEDVMVSLTNNPLLKGGVPERKEASPGGASPRDLEF